MPSCLHALFKQSVLTWFGASSNPDSLLYKTQYALAKQDYCKAKNKNDTARKLAHLAIWFWAHKALKQEIIFSGLIHAVFPARQISLVIKYSNWCMHATRAQLLSLAVSSSLSQLSSQSPSPASKLTWGRWSLQVCGSGIGQWKMPLLHARYPGFFVFLVHPVFAKPFIHLVVGVKLVMELNLPESFHLV